MDDRDIDLDAGRAGRVLGKRTLMGSRGRAHCAMTVRRGRRLRGTGAVVLVGPEKRVPWNASCVCTCAAVCEEARSLAVQRAQRKCT